MILAGKFSTWYVTKIILFDIGKCSALNQTLYNVYVFFMIIFKKWIHHMTFGKEKETLTKHTLEEMCVNREIHVRFWNA